MGDKSSQEERTRIRRAAIVTAISVAFFGTIIGPVFGRSLPQAASNGAAAAIVGLAGWTVYHLVSRRNNGLAFFIMSTYPITAPNHVPFVSAVATSLLAIVPIAWLIALTTRGLKPTAEAPRASAGLYDPDVDAAGWRR